jgi:hypothetical protein
MPACLLTGPKRVSVKLAVVKSRQLAHLKVETLHCVHTLAPSSTTRVVLPPCVTVAFVGLLSLYIYMGTYIYPTGRGS